MQDSETTPSDETLMAYADGELEPAMAARIEAMLRADPSLAARVASHRALRTRVQAAFAAELDEPVPQRLVDAATAESAKASAAARVVPLDSAQRRRETSAWRSPLPLAAAASLVLGIAIGYVAGHRPNAILREDPSGALVAGGRLSAALTHQLAGAGAPGGVDIGISFVSRSGEYCRTFRIGGRAAAAGLACRGGPAWQIEALAPAGDGRGADGAYRTAGSGLPAAVLDAVDARIVGAPLDRAAETAARARNWRSPSQ